MYDPPVPHEAVLKSQVDDRLHFVVDSIPVRFDEGNFREVLMTVEGELPGAVLQDYVELVRQRLSELEGCAYVAERSKA